MAMIIRSDHDLPTLRIMVDPTPATEDAVFQVVRGQDTPHEVTRCSVRELGLPESLGGRESVDDNLLTVPDHVVARLVDAVAGLGPSPMEPHNALWLEFPSPRGFLYVMPWERLLVALGRCLFRLPNHLVRPQAPGDALEVAICSSAPLAKSAFEPHEAMLRLARQYLDETGHDLRLHLFTDVAWYGMLGGALASDAALADRVVLHDPAQADSYPRPERTSRISSTAEVSNPWLRWILDSMGGRRLDVVHFATHGYLSGERGALALASTPTLNTDRELSRFVGSVELTSFLTQLGAWGLMLTGPPYNFSEAGLREVADAVALVLPGVALTHALERDPEALELGQALQTVFGADPQLSTPLPSTTLWVHPRFVEFPDADRADLHVNADGSSAFIPQATRDALAHADTEAWVASASRCLEQLQVRWLPDAEGQEADPAAVTALRNVAAMVERHVARSYPGGDTTGGAS